MSVPVGKRTESKLQVLHDVKVLASYTVCRCKSEKLFPKRNRWILIKPIVDECLAALSCIRHANATFVRTKGDFIYRHSEQVKAHAHLDAMIDLLDVAYCTIPEFRHNGNIEHWTELITNADKCLKSWTDSDFKRYQ